jgi:phytoene desaturase (3,4-didehydrolycopene-forming)
VANAFPRAHPIVALFKLQGCDAILVLVPCESLSHRADFAKLPRDAAISEYKDQFDQRQAVSRAREAVLRRMAAIESLKDLRSHIVDEVVDTPGTYADQYNLAGGSPFGLSHGFAQLSLARPGPESSKLDNVMFCGASSRPGNGVPLVLMGAKLVAQRAINKLKKMVQAEGEE